MTALSILLTLGLGIVIALVQIFIARRVIYGKPVIPHRYWKRQKRKDKELYDLSRKVWRELEKSNKGGSNEF
jgi:hypothetical protein